MATITQSGLFPPQVDNFLPAYNTRNVLGSGSNQGITVYYNISQYNDIDDINSAHFTFIRQTNYHSILRTDRDKYPGGIIAYNKDKIIKTTSDDPIAYQGDGWYKTFFKRSEVFNFNSDGNSSELAYNTYYKFQVRLSKDTIPSDKLTGTALSSYLNDEANLPLFSEWSQVCLLRFIAPRSTKFRVEGNAGKVLTASMDSLDYPFTLPNFLEISGNWTAATEEDSDWVKTSEHEDWPLTPTEASKYGASVLDGNKYDNEYMVAYQLSFYKASNNELVHQSPEITAYNGVARDEYHYNVPYVFENGDYIVKLHFRSANLYEEEKTITIHINYDEQLWTNGPCTETTGVDTVVGKVSICLEKKPNRSVSSIAIKRSDHTSDFKVWDIVYANSHFSDSIFPLTFDDYTIESGTLYKYHIEVVEGITRYAITEGPALSIFDHAFLTGEHTQLSVKFNPNISSYKHTISDNIVNTIGSQFPIITRNGEMNYRTFSLSGTIAYEMDIRHEFATQDDIYQGYVDVFGSYFVNHYINSGNDRLTQRKFRELVMAFLYDDKPKLFRSTPEGNVLVRITDVSLTPNQSLGRMIYDFSCTATEIGEATIENCKLYDIQDFGKA